MENSVIILLLAAYTFFVFRKPFVAAGVECTLRKWFPAALALLIVACAGFLLSFFLWIDDSPVLFVISYFLFVLIVALFYIYVRMFAGNAYWYWCLFIPLAFLFLINLPYLNAPTYHGAMDGFAGFYNALICAMILITYPAYMFVASMAKCKNRKIKGGILLAIAVMSLYPGATLSIGCEGYLADDMGIVFAFIVLLQGVVAFRHLLR